MLAMRSISVRPALVVALAASMLAPPRALAAEYFVAPGGSDSAAGTLAAPFASLTRGQQAASPGDTVWIRGGVYAFSGTTGSATPVLFTKSGQPGKRINYFAYPGETPAFDFFNYLPQQRIRGFSVRADYLHFRGLELRGVQQTITTANESWGIRVENGGDNNIFEQLDLHHNEGPGLFIVSGGNNLVLNCDSHHNYDPDRGGENADGFGSHSPDPGNRFVGNRAWENSDDGFDLINSPGRVVIENSWSWRNGYIPGTNTGAGNGAGFKSGGFGLDSPSFPAPGAVPRHVIQNNVAFSNRSQGFYANHHPGGIDFLNNTAFGNSRGFDLLNDVEIATWPAAHYLRNNVSFSNNTNLANANQALIDHAFNTWNAGLAASAADFVSLSPAGVDGPRQSDGSLPHLDFLRLKPASNLIDKGADVGLPFLGPKPDLGAMEYVPPDADFNRDARVDARDYIIWQQGLGLDAQTGYANGDANGDSKVDAADLAIWRAQYGRSADPSATPAPEPAGVVLVLGLAAGIGLTPRRQRVIRKTYGARESGRRPFEKHGSRANSSGPCCFREFESIAISAPPFGASA
jgi:hypothetical protein